MENLSDTGGNDEFEWGHHDTMKAFYARSKMHGLTAYGSTQEVAFMRLGNMLTAKVSLEYKFWEEKQK